MSAPMTLAAWVYVLDGRSVSLKPEPAFHAVVPESSGGCEEPRVAMELLTVGDRWSAKGSRGTGSGWLSSASCSTSCGPKDEVRGERIDGREERPFAEEAGTMAAFAALAT